MIDTKIFNLEKLVDWLIGCPSSYPEKIWIKDCEIFIDKENRIIIKHESKGNSTHYLRYSKGPRQGYSWDCYGDNFLTPEIALLALSKAPIPHYLIERS